MSDSTHIQAESGRLPAPSADQWRLLQERLAEQTAAAASHWAQRSFARCGRCGRLARDSALAQRGAS